MSNNPSAILEATETFVCDLNGERVAVHHGLTRVSASSDIAKAYPARFRPIEDSLSFSEETADANPGEHRTRSVPVEEPVVEETPTEPVEEPQKAAEKPSGAPKRSTVTGKRTIG